MDTSKDSNLLILEAFKNILDTKQFQIHDRISIHWNEELLKLIHDDFSNLLPTQKTGFLLALMPRKRMNLEMKETAKNIINIALNDDDFIVQLVGVMLKDYLSTNTISTTDFNICLSSEQIALLESQVVTSDQALFVSRKVLKVRERKCAVKFKSSFVFPSASLRYASYGINSDGARSEDKKPIKIKSLVPNSNININTATINRNFSGIKSGGLKTVSSGFQKTKKMQILDLVDLESSLIPVQGKLKKGKEKRKDGDDLKVKKEKKRRVEKQEGNSSDIVRGENLDMMMEEDGNSSKDLNSESKSNVNDDPSTPLQSSSNLESIMGQEVTALSQHDRDIIKRFLEGKFEKNNEKREFFLTERTFKHDDGLERLEKIYMVLDYDKSKWSKVKRTKKI